MATDRAIRHPAMSEQRHILTAALSWIMSGIAIVAILDRPTHKVLGRRWLDEHLSADDLYRQLIRRLYSWRRVGEPAGSNQGRERSAPHHQHRAAGMPHDPLGVLTDQ
jgi:hypothetical protein